MRASFERLDAGTTITMFPKDGRMVVRLETKGDYTERGFKDIAEAHEVFQKLISWIIYGFYSDKSRHEYLATGTMR